MSSCPPLPLADTRERLLQTAVIAFGQRDYDGVSTREIVEAAKTNISAISYHFGGKRGLYLATVEYLAEQVRGELAGSMATVHHAIADGDPTTCTDTLCEFMGGYLELLLCGRMGQSVHGILFREHSQPTEAYGILYQKLLQPLHATLSGLVARCHGESRESYSTILLAHTLLGQAVFFSVARNTLLKRLDKPEYTPSLVEQLKRHLSSNCRCLIRKQQDTKDELS
jgi:TetR/AcrR family transcriptional regulator, regulator of cefoperazone and chloramphenicol sensitivity